MTSPSRAPLGRVCIRSARWPATCCAAPAVKQSYSRPRVSDDNADADAESLFRTVKYRPESPAKGFVDLDQARARAAVFLRWRNHDRCHSGIRYVGPAQRHAGQDHTVPAARQALHVKARQRNRARWSGNTRNWSPAGPVALAPERDGVINTATADLDVQPKAA